MKWFSFYIGCKLKSTPDLTQSESSSDAVLSSLKVKDEPIDMDKLQLSAGLVAEKAVNGLNELPIIKVKLETSNEASPCITVKKERPDNEENNSDSKCTPDNAAECKASDESMTNSAGETLNLPETNESKNFIAEIKDCSLQSCSVVSGSVEGLKKTPYNGELCISVADQPMTSAADTVNELVPRNICEVQRVSDLNADETKAVCTDREDQLVSNNNSTLIHTEEKIVSQDLQSVSGNSYCITR